MNYEYAETMMQNELLFSGLEDIYDISDFYVEYYEVSDNSESINDIHCVEEPPVALENMNLNVISDNNLNLEMVNDGLPIDASYYYFDILNRKFWYNAYTGDSEQVVSTPSSPYMGDGNNRYRLGYRWFPGTVEASFFSGNFQGLRTFVDLYFTFSSSELQYLNVDSNEALEMEVVFYNYTNPQNPEDTGYSFVPVDGNPSMGTEGLDFREPVSWSATFENAYLDTSFFDNQNEISSCVGIYDTSDLVANQRYFWRINYAGCAIAQGYPNDGRYRVVAQRSYRIAPESLIEGSDEFMVFSEEKEGIIKYGLSGNQNWVDASLSAFVPNGTLRRWDFDISTDPVKHE